MVMKLTSAARLRSTLYQIATLIMKNINVERQLYNRCIPAGTKKHWPKPVPAPMQAIGAVLVLGAAYRLATKIVQFNRENNSGEIAAHHRRTE